MWVGYGASRLTYPTYSKRPLLHHPRHRRLQLVDPPVIGAPQAIDIRAAGIAFLQEGALRVLDVAALAHRNERRRPLIQRRHARLLLAEAVIAADGFLGRAGRGGAIQRRIVGGLRGHGGERECGNGQQCGDTSGHDELRFGAAR